MKGAAQKNYPVHPKPTHGVDDENALHWVSDGLLVALSG